MIRFAGLRRLRAGQAAAAIEVETVAVPGEGPEDTLIDEDGSVLTGL